MINNDEAAVHHFLNINPTTLFLNRLVGSKKIPYCTNPDEYDDDDDDDDDDNDDDDDDDDDDDAADDDDNDRYYLSPLYITIKHGSFSLMTRMIELGASLQKLSNYDENALHAVCYSKVDSVA